MSAPPKGEDARGFLELADKYREILRLRQLDQGDTRSAMADLARRFPGSLRELDRLPMVEVERRIAVLEAVAAGAAPPPPWALWFRTYHGVMRAALRIKRLCRNARDADDALRHLEAHYRPEVDEPTLSSLGRAGVWHVLHPAGGRLNSWAFSQVAQAHGCTHEHARAVLFPSPEQLDLRSTGSTSSPSPHEE